MVNRQTANQFLINGFMAKEVQHGTNSIEPIIDALQEFRVQSTNYTAEFGTEAWGQINAVMKSGTNEFHGAAWEFLRNDELDANNFFNNRAGRERPVPAKPARISGGGPFYLPKYDARNKTFIFGAARGSARKRKESHKSPTLPTPAMRGRFQRGGDGPRSADRSAVSEQRNSAAEAEFHHQIDPAAVCTGPEPAGDRG